ncbi:MAG: transglutaminase domain-containing protein [Bacteroidales bacterium]|nr:transglutaminase domain-containing protein [Bacteroidales bacterium]
MRRTLIISLVVGCLVGQPAMSQVATVLESATEFECTGAKTATLRERRVTVIRNNHGDSFAVFQCWCRPGDDLSRFSGEIADAQGKVIKKIKKSDLTRSEYSTEFQSDDFFYFYQYTPTSYPVTVTYEWEEKFTGGLRAYPLFMPQMRYDVDVREATYRFIATPDNTMHWHARNFTPDVVTREEGNKQITEFSLRDLPAVKAYSFGQDIDELVPSVILSPLSFTMEGFACDMTNWETFGKWVHSLRQGRDVLPDAVKQKVHALTDTCTTDRSKVETIRRFMGDNTRYVSIQLGIGGYQPMTIDDVVKKGMGDCKALTSYFCTMLNEVGIPANYALISTEYKDMFPDFPSFSQLNHVIAQVPLPNDTLWVECTNARVPYDYRPSSWAGHEALLITPEGGKLARVPVIPDEENNENNVIRIAIEENGNARVSLFSTEYNLCFEHDMPLALMSSAEQRKVLLESLNMPKSSISVLDVKTEGKKLSLKLEAISEGFGRVSGSRIFVPFSLRPYSALRNPKEPAHVIDLEKAGYVSTDSIVIVLPEGYAIESAPKSQTVTSEFGNYSLECNVEGNEVSLVCVLKIKSGIYAADLFEQWVAFRKVVSSICSGKIIIKKI